VIVAVCVDGTWEVLTVKIAVVAPDRTVTLGGTTAAALLLDSDTEMPPEGAAEEIVTVPVEGVPAVTVVGLRVTELSD
jgi:hypothetical protein